MGRSRSNRCVFGSTIGLIALSACNALLDNDPRAWDPNAGADAGAPASGGAPTAGKAGASGKSGAAGSSGKAGSSGRGGGGGAAGSGRGGTTSGEAGSGDAAPGGEAGLGGEAGPGGEAGVGGAGTACECMPGELAVNVEPCGACMTGMRMQTKTCTDECVWGEFGEFGECMGVTATCTPGAPGTQTVPCSCGGSKGQSRTCTDACEWGAWSDTSSCDLECCSEIVYCNTPNDISPASRGTWCRRKASSPCSNAEVTSDCHADIETVCGAVVPELYIQY